MAEVAVERRWRGQGREQSREDRVHSAQLRPAVQQCSPTGGLRTRRTRPDPGQSRVHPSCTPTTDVSLSCYFCTLLRSFKTQQLVTVPLLFDVYGQPATWYFFAYPLHFTSAHCVPRTLQRSTWFQVTVLAVATVASRGYGLSRNAAALLMRYSTEFRPSTATIVRWQADNDVSSLLDRLRADV